MLKKVFYKKNIKVVNIKKLLLSKISDGLPTDWIYMEIKLLQKVKSIYFLTFSIILILTILRQ